MTFNDWRARALELADEYARQFAAMPHVALDKDSVSCRAARAALAARLDALPMGEPEGYFQFDSDKPVPLYRHPKDPA